MFNYCGRVELNHKVQTTTKRSFLMFWIYSKVFKNHKMLSRDVALKIGNEMINDSVDLKKVKVWEREKLILYNVSKHQKMLPLKFI